MQKMGHLILPKTGHLSVPLTQCMSFVFYDTETTGTNTSFDQILQFGAIRTDHELREMDRFEIRCRLLPYVVPAPGAIRTTGITVEQLTDPGLPTHYEMVRAIKAKLKEWSPRWGPPRPGSSRTGDAAVRR